ncbi:uncharacterized protein [Watersipora subatra]|uniref:uncharacterized protein n=1 Tax=Watersipora subatra TaxID=2589382 RepID=UPI00355B2987
MENCKPVATPAAYDVKLSHKDGSKLADPNLYQLMVGSLLYAAVSTRPNIAEAVGALAKFNACPTQTHLTAAKRVIRHLKGTKDLCLNFRKQGRPMVGYTYANNASDADRHSKSGAVFINTGCPINLSSISLSISLYYGIRIYCVV